MKIKVAGKTRKLGAEDFEYAPGYLFTYDPACRDYDWLVVFDDLVDGTETLACPRERTILATWEPVGVKPYSRGFTRQFGHYLTNRPWSAERHPHYRLGRGYFPWCLGRTYAEVVAKRDYPKTADLSAVCSNKSMRHTAHHDRMATLRRLKAEIPGMAWYGIGFDRIAEKHDALDAFRYHVAIENHIAPNHWSEKLPDAILCECLPFYAGDPLLGETLPPESFIRIPHDNPDEAVRIVKAAIANDEWSRRLPAIRRAKELLLSKYNFWAQVVELIESARNQPVTPADPARPIVVYGHRAYRNRHPLAAVEDFVRRAALYLPGNAWRYSESAETRRLSAMYKKADRAAQDALASAVASALGVKSVTLKPAGACVWPVYKAEAPGAAAFVKVAPESNVARTMAFLESVRGCRLIPRPLCPPIDLDGRTVLVTEWLEGRRIDAERMTDAEADAFLAGIIELSKALASAPDVIPGGGRDSPDVQYAAIAEYARRHPAASRRLEPLLSIPEAERSYGSRPLSVIHGDMHSKNYAFSGGRLAAVFDFDNLIRGLPCEDVAYAFTERMRRSAMPAESKARLRALFARLAAASPWPADEWRIAVNHSRLRIASRRVLKHMSSPFVAFDVERRDSELRPLLEELR